VRLKITDVQSSLIGIPPDQVQAIKKELVLLVPSLKVFLDVDDLVDIGSLEKLIEGSDVTLFFLSKGYTTHRQSDTSLIVASLCQ
jgi:hypothetical protein